VPDDPLWFKDAVIYETHVRAFADSDGDGIGDFRGLTGKLDYLQDLGVTAIWLLPFYPSPLRDDGYDIADYDTVNPMYGNVRDFKRFVKEAHARDLRVITELVINHTSDQHPWFRRAVKAPPGSPERDFYVWSDDPSRYPETRIIFQDFESSNWQWHPEAGQYYWHRFYSHQPDLNFDNPAVREAVAKALDHWMAMGVDGMRLDAIPYLFERDGTNNENLPETHDYLKELRAHLDARWDDRMFLAEANQWPEDAAAYFGDGDECHMNFHFPLMPRLYMAVAMEDRFPIIDILQQTPEIPDNTQWAVFLRNHDELTLEMVTDEERDYMRRIYAADPRMRINLGIRRRLAPLLNNDRRLIELMNALLLSLPGTPVLYYGDEIGMGDNVYLGDRDGVRTPMQWNGDRNAGFSSANPQKLYLPVIIDPEYHFETVNVEAQRNNPRSLWWWMKRTIGLRRQHELFGRGDIRFLHPDNPRVLAFVRESSEGAEHHERVLVVANLSRHAQACNLDMSEFAGTVPIEMFGSTPFPAFTEQPYQVTLAPYAYHWFILEHERERLDVGYPGASSLPVPAAEELPVVSTTVDGHRLVQGDGGSTITRRLDDILPTQRWFAAKARRIRRITALDHATVTSTDGRAGLLLAEVEYTTGDPDVYAITLGFAAADRAERVGEDAPASLLARVHGRGDAPHGVLFDALWDPAVGRSLLDVIRRKRSLPGRHGTFAAWRSSRFPLPASASDLEVRPLHAEQSNTSLLFGDQYVLKVVRRPDEGPNPDLEVTRFLTERAGFEHVPPLVGAIEYQAGPRSPSRTVALLQKYVPNEGEAWEQAVAGVERWLEDDISSHDQPAAIRRSPVRLARAGVPEAVEESLGATLTQARQLGVTTARMHAALASDDEDEDFRPEEFTSLYQRSVFQSMRTRTKRTFQLLERTVDGLEGTPGERARELAGREGDVLERFEHLKTHKLTGQRTRSHGDYHLGQVLWTGRDYVILDFEGEPALPVGERRLKRSPLRDVAGMLRSYQYASHVAVRRLVEQGAAPREDADGPLGVAADWWGTWMGVAFLEGYLAEVPDGLLPETDPELTRLLDAYLLEKSLYELAYELNNRPDWVTIPLRGIATQLATPLPEPASTSGGPT
jgi:maltose alpha-D-glucosyltransferase/alpha-amylase